MLIISSLYFMLPAYFANMAPIIVKKLFNFLAKPIDFGKKLNGKPIFGKNKTWRGLVFGVVFGIIVAYLQFVVKSPLDIVDYSNWLMLGLLMGFGAIFGDMIESFVKRQFDIKPGQRFFPWDQIDFVIGSLLLSYFFIPYDMRIKVIIIVLLISPLLHIIVNHSAFYLGIRNEKW